LRIALISAYNDRCYGLRCIASYLRRRGHEVWLLCFKCFQSVLVPRENREAWNSALSATYPPITESWEEGTMLVPYIHPSTEQEWQLFLDKLSAIRPDLIGLTVATSSYEASCEATRRIRRLLPGVPIIWGGIHATICPEECLQNVDMVCVGEGEEAMAELAADPERTDIVGIWRRRNGQIIRTPFRPLEQDLDRFPFASYGESEWLFEKDQATELTVADKTYFQPIYLSLSQRGCPFLCTYCAHHTIRPRYRGERYVRRRSVDHVLDECARRVRDFGLPTIIFFDDIFVMNRKWIEEFVEKYPKRVGVPFGAYAHPFVSNEAMLRQLKQAGMIFVGIGIQTGSDYVSREIYGRNHGGEEILQLAQAAERNGLILCYDILSNNPYESEADCLDTLRLLTRMPKPYSVVVKKVIFYPGSRISKLDKPRPNLPETTFEFWNQLYLISRHHLIPAEHLLALGQDEYLKANPQIMRSIALGLKRMVEAQNAGRAEVDRLLTEERQVTVRGFLRYTKRLIMSWLPKPIAEALRALKRRLRPTSASR